MKSMEIDFERLLRHQLPTLKVLVIGDIILDRYIWGSVERTSPEAPVPIVNVEAEEFILGGAANVANNLTALGIQTKLMGLIGKDLSGKRVLKLLKQAGINSEFIIIDETRPTILKSRILSSGQQLIRFDQEKKHSPTPLILKKAIKNFSTAVTDVDGIIVSDYNKGFLIAEFLKTAISEARERGKKIVVDPKGEDFSKYSGVDALTPNVKETQEATGIIISDKDSLIKAGKKLLAITRAKCVAVTRGAEGVALFQPRHQPEFIAGHRRNVYDITGAGDTFISHFASGYFSGVDFYHSAVLGNYAAAITVSKLGVATVSPDELLSFIRGESYLAKRKSLPELLQIIRSLKSQGKKIVFTNGCFDLLHIGHIKFLEQARNLGDCLIVAINSDSSVRRIKGHPRPIISENDRADILSALHFVDYVVIFEEDEPLNLIRSIQPDVLVKGKNLRPEEIVGRDIVLAYGGKVQRLPFFNQISTEQLIQSIRKEK
ncbi:MAG: D-glycero-beta-D-manno-heptose 1-phosphate adenylyltransferase [Candidatus Sumerlaeia bacterium]|nr:D-glycero-beta-D-manno-heptose 1-phosphate adenylyltransferase [Candidatus Sumerlaeia bacterium]